MSAPPHLFSIFHETTSHALTARSTTRNPSNLIHFQRNQTKAQILRNAEPRKRRPMKIIETTLAQRHDLQLPTSGLRNRFPKTECLRASALLQYI